VCFNPTLVGSADSSSDFTPVRLGRAVGAAASTLGASTFCTLGAVVFGVDGNGSAKDSEMLVNAVFTAETTGALAVAMT